VRGGPLGIWRVSTNGGTPEVIARPAPEGRGALQPQLLPGGRNNVHMMMYEADAAKREAWIASVDAIAALNPKIVVAGHKSVGAADGPENLAANQQYLRDFTALAKKGGTVEDLVHGTLALHGERDQPHTLWIPARAEVARRVRAAATRNGFGCTSNGTSPISSRKIAPPFASSNRPMR
jgi:hypothetical protein